MILKKKLYLVDGTYDLYRMFYGTPKKLNSKGQEIGAGRSFLSYLYQTVKRDEVTHIAVAFSTIIESFRNDLLPGYKKSDRVPPDLFSQFKLAEQITEALGISCWGMIAFEGDDAIATLVAKFKDNAEIDQIVILSPDKDFAQCIVGTKVIMFDSVRNVMYDQEAVKEKWGVGTESITDLLALMGDRSDGIPGIPRWGHKSSSMILSKFKHIENIPDNPDLWGVKIRGSHGLAQSLRMHRKEANLYKYVATLRTDVPMNVSLNELQWKGADRNKLGGVCEELEFPEFLSKIEKWLN